MFYDKSKGIWDAISDLHELVAKLDTDSFRKGELQHAGNIHLLASFDKARQDAIANKRLINALADYLDVEFEEIPSEPSRMVVVAKKEGAE